MKEARIGIFGIGHNHGAPAVQALKNLKNVKIVGLYEEDDETYAKRLKENPTVYGDIPRMGKEELFSTGLTAAFVEESVPKLVKRATECAEHGLHVHMDKPAGTDLDEYKKFLTVVKEKNLVFQTGYMYRYNAGIKYAVEKAKDGSLGKIYNVTAQMSTKHPEWFKKQLLSYNVKAPVAFIFGGHLIDLCMKVKGVPENLTAYHTVSGDGGIDFEDTSLIVMKYKDGLATVKVSSIEANGWGMREFTVFGEKGSVCVRPLENPTVVTETLNGDEKPWSDVHNTVNVEEKGRYDDMVKEFVEEILGERENDTDVGYEYELQKLTLLACGYEV